MWPVQLRRFGAGASRIQPIAILTQRDCEGKLPESVAEDDLLDFWNGSGIDHRDAAD